MQRIVASKDLQKKKKVASKVLQEALSSNPSVDMGLSWTGLNRNS